jgi:hypothetical protein
MRHNGLPTHKEGKTTNHKKSGVNSSDFSAVIIFDNESKKHNKNKYIQKNK